MSLSSIIQEKNKQLIKGNTIDKVLSEEFLKSISFKTSLNKSTNKVNITQEIVDMVIADTHTMKTILLQNDLLMSDDIAFRIKTPDSITKKVRRHPDLRFQSVFNDIIGIRLRANINEISIPDYFRVVDMTNGKSIDDGYRAVHLYYKPDNYSYIIEIQLWSDEDYDFNHWSHIYGYKVAESSTLLRIRDDYDKGLVKSEEDFCRRLEEYA